MNRLECDLEYLRVFNCGVQACIIGLRTEMQQRVAVLSSETTQSVLTLNEQTTDQEILRTQSVSTLHGICSSDTS